MNYLRIIVLLTVAALIFVPMFFAPEPLESEVLLVPRWSRDIRSGAAEYEAVVSGSEQSPLYPERWIPVFHNDSLVYVSTLGEVGAYEESDFHLSYDSTGYFNTRQYHNTLVLRGPRGGIDNVLQSNWFPVIGDNQVLLVSPDGLGLRGLDDQLEEMFTREWASLITAVKPVNGGDQSLIAVGLLDGRLILLNSLGDQLFSTQLKGESKFAVIYSIQHVVSKPGIIELAVTAGVEPMHFFYITLEQSDGEEWFQRSLLSRTLPFQHYSFAPVFVQEKGFNQYIFHFSMEERHYSIRYNLIDQMLSRVYSQEAPGKLTAFWQLKPGLVKNGNSKEQVDEDQLSLYRSPGSTVLEWRGASEKLIFKSARPVDYSLNYDDGMLIQRINSRLYGYSLEDG